MQFVQVHLDGFAKSGLTLSNVELFALSMGDYTKYLAFVLWSLHIN